MRSEIGIELKREMQVMRGSMHEETTPMAADAKKVQQDAHKQMTDYVNVKHKEIEQINQELATLRTSTTALSALTSAKHASIRAFMAEKETEINEKCSQKNVGMQQTIAP